MAGARPSGLLVLALLLGASVLCSGGPGGLADRRRSPAVEAESFSVNLDLYQEDEEEDDDIDFFQLGDDPLGAIEGAVGGAGAVKPVSIWPMEGADASYKKDVFGRRRYDPATTTFKPEEAENASTPCVVNGSSSPEVVTVKVPVYSSGNGTAKGEVKTVIETKYVPVNTPGETKYIPMPGVPYGVPGAAAAADPSSTGCPCTAAPPVNLAPADWPVGCPPPTAPCVSSSSAVARVAAAAADLAHHNLQQALANAVTPSPLAQSAHAIAQQAATRAAAAEDSAALAKANVQGVKLRMKRLRNRLYYAATARAAELNKVRVVPPTFPISIIPQGPTPQLAYGAYGWAPAPAPAAVGYVR